MEYKIVGDDLKKEIQELQEKVDRMTTYVYLLIRNDDRLSESGTSNYNKTGMLKLTEFLKYDRMIKEGLEAIKRI